MPLSAGDKLGPYEILAPIGAGGMGEVYRALDTRLGRDVALKILPADVAGDTSRAEINSSGAGACLRAGNGMALAQSAGVM